jgi:hypothetical protein
VEHSRSSISIQDPTCRGLSSRMDALRIKPYGFEVMFSIHEAVCRLRRINLPRTPHPEPPRGDLDHPHADHAAPSQGLAVAATGPNKMFQQHRTAKA